MKSSRRSRITVFNNPYFKMRYRILRLVYDSVTFCRVNLQGILEEFFSFLRFWTSSHMGNPVDSLYSLQELVMNLEKMHLSFVFSAKVLTVQHNKIQADLWKSILSHHYQVLKIHLFFSLKQTNTKNHSKPQSILTVACTSTSHII